MRNQFTVFDVETANKSGASICSIGIAVVRDNVIIDEFYSLVNPETYFSSANIAVHGIRERDVEDAPTFKELWPSIQAYFEDTLVLAHFATFDISCLRASLDRYQLGHPSFQYSCTCVLGRRLLPECYNHKLNTLAEYYGFTFEHHNAMEDARVAANIAIRYLEANGMDDMDDLHSLYNIKYRSFLITKPASRYAKVPVPKPVFTKANEGHILYRKHICITGTLKEERSIVYQRLALVGAFIDESVNVMTDFLVIGESKRTTSKMKLAQRLQDESHLQIIDEDLFYTMLTYKPAIANQNNKETRNAEECQEECAQEAPNYLLELRKVVGTRPLLAPGSIIVHFNDQQQILLTLRNDTNNWGLPGGSMELGESLEECAKREFLEETGMEASQMEYLTVFSGAEYYFKYPNGDEVYSICHLYLANDVSGDFGIHDEENRELRYFDLYDLPEMESRSELMCEWISSHFEDILNLMEQ